MNMPNRKLRLSPPLQARPVRRDHCSAPAAQHLGDGAQAARSSCADLPGAARQLCYIARHGVAT